MGKKWIHTLIITALATALVSCGKQAYVVTAITEEQASPGNFIIPAKVDILLAEDDTGSLYEAYPQVSTQIPEFLKKLESQGWDYHFATIPLTAPRSISQVLASKYDSNWGSLWKIPFPGAQPGSPGTVSSGAFTLPETYSGFLTQQDMNNQLGGSEPGLSQIVSALTSSAAKSTNFLRDDAMTVVLVVGNGNDTSGVNICKRSDGFYVSCEEAGELPCGSPGANASPNCGSSESSFIQIKNALEHSRPQPQQINFFSAVAKNSSNTCLGSRATLGSRYIRMANELGGQAYDVCSQPISNILDSLASKLQGTKIAFRTRYLFVASDPNPNNITVTRYPGGDLGRGENIPRDASNGWTYAGYLKNIYTIDSPIPMNQGSGYAIELHGSAKLMGDDTAKVTFTPAGAKDSAAK